MTIRDIAVAFGFDVDQKSVDAAENTIKNIKSFAMKALGAIAIGFSFSALNSIAEEFNGINDEIKAATKGMGNQQDIQQRILKAANDTKSSYSDMAGFVTQLVKQDGALFGDLETATEFASLTTKVLKTAGRADVEIALVQSKLSDAFSEGGLAGGKLAEILKSYPEVLNTVSDGLGVTKGQLLSMAEAGKITSKTIVNAFSGAADTIGADFDGLDYSISDAVTNIRNSWGLFVNDLWVGSGITNGIGKMMVRVFNGFLGVLKKLQPYIERLIRFLLSGIQRAMDLLSRISAFIGRLVGSLGGVENAMRLVSIAAGAVWLALNAGKVLDFLKKVKGLLSVAHSKVFTMAAAVAILALLIEDFINFMQGNDSVIGVLFDKAGIDADGMRQKIKAILGNLEAFFSGIWNAMREAAAPILETIQGMLEGIFGEDLFVGLGEGVAGVIGFLERITDALAGNTEVQEFFGKAAVGIITVVTALKGIAPVVRNVTSLFKAVSGVVKGAGAVIGFLTSPVGIAAAAIAALIAVGILLYKNWDKVKEFAISIWTSIAEFFQGIWNGIVGFFEEAIGSIMGAISPIADFFIRIFQSAWDGICSVFSGASSFFQGVWDSVVGVFATIGTVISDAISGAVSGAVNRVLGGAAGIINGFIRAINFAIGVINKIPGVEISKLSELEVPQLAEGGIATDATSAIIGEGAEPEAVMPLSKLGGMISGYIKEAKESKAGQAAVAFLKDAAGKISSAASALGRAVKVNPATVAGSRANVSVVQNVEINNSYTGGDKEAQKNVAKGMRKSATDATTQMARALAYAR